MIAQRYEDDMVEDDDMVDDGKTADLQKITFDEIIDKIR